MGANGMFQVPKHGNSAKTFDDTTSDNAPIAYTIELTRVTPPAASAEGKVSGRFVVVIQDDASDGAHHRWAAGTFTDAPYSVW